MEKFQELTFYVLVNLDVFIWQLYPRLIKLSAYQAFVNLWKNSSTRNDAPAKLFELINIILIKLDLVLNFS